MIKIITLINALDNASYGSKQAIYEHYSKIYNMPVKTLQYQVHKYAPKRIRKGSLNPELLEYTKRIYALYAKLPQDGRMPGLQDMIEIAENAGINPKGKLTVSTARRYANILGLNCTMRKHTRFSAQYANQEHVVDFSGSEYFGVKEKLTEGNDDYLLYLKEKGSSGTYKNKDDNSNERVWVGIVVDRYSGIFYIKYYVAPGEGGEISADLLESAWQKKTNHPLYGLPENLQTDNSSFFKSRNAKTMFEQLNIKPKPHAVGNPAAKGKVEVRFKHLWRSFEKFFFLIDNCKEFKLSEINKHAKDYANKSNSYPHKKFIDKTRKQAYLESLAGQTVRLCPENFSHYLFFEDKRTPDECGIISIDNKPYQIVNCEPTMFKKQVIIYKNIEGKIVAQDPKTKKIYSVKPHKDVPYGEYKGKSLTPQQRLLQRQKIAPTYEQHLPIQALSEDKANNIVYLSRNDMPEDETPYTPARHTLSWEKKKEIFTANIGYSFCSITEILGEKRNEQTIAKLREFETEEEIINLAQQLLPLIEQSEMLEAVIG